ncbi:MAG: thioredoxin [Verrucomicrobiales bacterium]|nr:thioredoxin [Verrucomicrobiales bacterium]
MKALLIFTIIAFSLRTSAAPWLTDLPTAMKIAREERKTVLLDFTGSDWCPACKMMKVEVFDKPEFHRFADANLVLVEVDFPKAKTLSLAQHEANNYLMKRFGVEIFPTIILLDEDDKYRGKTGYVAGGPKAFIAELEQIPNVKRREPGTQVTSQSKEIFRPAAKIEYPQLALRAISGSKKPLALINNQSFAQGETAMVKLGDTKVKVLCEEIRKDSVLLQIEGQPAPVELRLKGKTPTIDIPAKTD